MRYRSRLEERLHKGVLKDCPYEAVKVSYKIYKECTYTPDFLVKGDAGDILIEAKGRFRTRDESNKYLYIRESLNQFDELVFLFQNPKTPMPGAKCRKDGTKQSVADWARHHGFRVFTEQNIGEVL